MNIKWYGHSCFLLTSDRGIKILTDPCDPKVGYNISGIEADAVTVSHMHFDHCFTDALRGKYIRLEGCVDTDVGGVKIKGFPSFHDEFEGEKRGQNTLFLIEIDGIRVLHCGDLGHVLSEEAAAELGGIDVLLVPVGGYYTIDHAQARQLANLLKPSVVIPMHYKTADCTVDNIEGLSPFISSVIGCKIHKLNQSEATLTRESLGDDRVLVLDYEKQA